MSERRIDVETGDGTTHKYIDVCDACGIEADPSATFTLTDWDDDLYDELGLEFSYDLDDPADPNHVHLCADCLFDGPGRGLRKIEQTVSEVINYDLDKEAIKARGQRMLLYAFAPLAWIPLLAHFWDLTVLAGGVLGVIGGATAMRYLWLSSAFHAYPD